MPYCSRCGVEVEKSVTHCPLCQTEIQDIEEKPVESKKYPDEEPALPKKVRTNKEKRRLAWEVTSVSLLIPLLINLFVDLIVNKTVSWSLYLISTLLFVWIIVTMPLLFPKNIPILMVGETVPHFIYLLVLDVIDNGTFDWYPRLGLPILSVVVLVVISVITGAIFVKNKGVNIAAFVMFGSGVMSVGIDFIVSSYLQGKFAISWSLYVLASTVVVGGFLLYIHFRILKGTDLKRRLQL